MPEIVQEPSSAYALYMTRIGHCLSEHVWKIIVFFKAWSIFSLNVKLIQEWLEHCSYVGVVRGIWGGPHGCHGLGHTNSNLWMVYNMSSRGLSRVMVIYVKIWLSKVSVKGRENKGWNVWKFKVKEFIFMYRRKIILVLWICILLQYGPKIVLFTTLVSKPWQNLLLYIIEESWYLCHMATLVM